MARGKEALAAANARLRAATEHIDRLTDQLAEAKAAARVAAHDAGLVPHLRAEVARLEALIDGDVLLAAAVDELAAWCAWAEKDEYHWNIQREAINVLLTEFGRFAPMAKAEKVEYLNRRLPVGFYRNDTAEARYHPFRSDVPRKLTDDQAVRLQRAIGERSPTLDVADMLHDWAEAQDAGFTDEEFSEYIADHRERIRRDLSKTAAQRLKEEREKKDA